MVDDWPKASEKNMLIGRHCTRPLVICNGNRYQDLKALGNPAHPAYLTRGNDRAWRGCQLWLKPYPYHPQTYKVTEKEQVTEFL